MALADETPPVPIRKTLSAETVKTQLKTQKAEKAELEKKAKKLQNEVGNLKKKLLTTTKKVQEHEQSLIQIEDRLERLQQKRDTIHKTLGRDQEALASLISAFQKLSRTPTSALITTSSPVEAARASLLMRASLPTLHNQANSLKEKILKLKELEGDIKADLTDQKSKKQALATQEQKLTQLLNKRQQIYKNTEERRKEKEVYVKKLAQQAKTLEELVNKLPTARNNASASRTGRSAVPPRNGSDQLPVAGRILTNYGETDALGAESMGITIGTRANATVVSPMAGTVRFAGAFQKFNHVLIVEHQGGYHSVIAGLGHIDVVVDATLATGEPVGVVDSSIPDPYIYYELRQKGKPINPGGVLASLKKQGKS